MNAPTALANRSSCLVQPLPADEENGLAALLDMFTTEEPSVVDTSARRTFRADGARVRAWTQEWLRRATAWGAGPGGAWRAW